MGNDCNVILCVYLYLFQAISHTHKGFDQGLSKSVYRVRSIS
jgi:hypothetical protein